MCKIALYLNRTAVIMGVAVITEFSALGKYVSYNGTSVMSLLQSAQLMSVIIAY